MYICMYTVYIYIYDYICIYVYVWYCVIVKKCYSFWSEQKPWRRTSTSPSEASHGMWGRFSSTTGYPGDQTGAFQKWRYLDSWVVYFMENPHISFQRRQRGTDSGKSNIWKPARNQQFALHRCFSLQYELIIRHSRSEHIHYQTIIKKIVILYYIYNT